MARRKLLLTVEAEDQDLVRAPGVGDRLLRAEAHHVALAEHRVDVLVLGEHVLHHPDAAVLGPLAELRREGDLDAGVLHLRQHPVAARVASAALPKRLCLLSCC